MKNPLHLVFLRGLPCVAALSLCAAGTVQAATTWDFSACNGTVATGANWGTCGAGNPSVRGFSTAASDASTSVVAWSGSGLGMVANSADTAYNGQHAVDNNGGRDALAFRFDQAVSLSSLTVGWNGTDSANGTFNDSDLSVYFWSSDTASAPTQFNSANGASGWTLVQHHTDVGGQTDQTQAITTSSYSSYWLVSAYNGTVYTTGNDAFKLLALAGNVLSTPPNGQSVPEPGSLALLGLGALGWMAVRRRQPT